MSVFESYEYEDPRGRDQEYAGEAYESFETYETFEVAELDPAQELELAQELMEITSEEELEEFLGKLVRQVSRGARAFMRSGIGKAVGGVLRNVAKTALPVVGSALGTFVAPGLGTAIGGKLGTMASKLLEAEELESMDEAEAELEAARRYVRWAAGTVRNGMRAPYGVPPRTVARAAAVSSARRYAPALLRPVHAGGGPRWRNRRRRPYRPYGMPYVGAGHVCTCGATHDPAWGDGAKPDVDDGDDPWVSGESSEVYEGEQPAGSAEASEGFHTESAPAGAAGAGRWFRRGNRIVLVGA